MLQFNVLHTQDLSIGYRGKNKTTVIATGINISLQEAQLVALVGSNGIGKSTLLRSITGIQKPLEGLVLLNERPLNQYNPVSLAKTMSTVLTEALPPSNLTVFELVALGRQPYTNWIGKLAAADLIHVKEAMVIAEVQELAHLKHFEISDGQLQKVLIARALAQDTPLIILDEPTTHLDLHHKIGLLRLLKKLTTDTRKCVLFSTHDIDLAIQVADSIIVMSRGQLKQDSPEHLIQQGVFDSLFDDENIYFDTSKGNFVFKNLK